MGKTLWGKPGIINADNSITKTLKAIPYKERRKVTLIAIHIAVIYDENFNSNNGKKDMIIVYWNNSKKAWIIPVLQMRDMVLTVIK